MALFISGILYMDWNKEKANGKVLEIYKLINTKVILIKDERKVMESLLGQVEIIIKGIF